MQTERDRKRGREQMCPWLHTERHKFIKCDTRNALLSHFLLPPHTQFYLTRCLYTSGALSGEKEEGAAKE